MLTDDEFYDIWKSDVINSLQLIYKKGYDDAKQELKREPLSYEQLEDLVGKYHGYPMTLGRAIEIEHKIGVDNE